jgi:hypothetical protein
MGDSGSAVGIRAPQKYSGNGISPAGFPLAFTAWTGKPAGPASGCAL